MAWSSKSQETEVRTIRRWVIQVRIPDPAKTTLSAINTRASSTHLWTVSRQLLPNQVVEVCPSYVQHSVANLAGGGLFSA